MMLEYEWGNPAAAAAAMLLFGDDTGQIDSGCHDRPQHQHPHQHQHQHQHHHPLVEMTQNATAAESDLMRAGRDQEEFESKSGSENIEGASGDDQDPNQRPKKKRYHRHTQHQIQEMEA